ncbi:hypothetical protein DL768_010898 [Monosporascus sp. mg162]|nr:hypothetical protein DL768_010898 [Monosporascus sp. mg162]
MAETSPSLSVHVKVTVDPSNSEAFLKALEPTYKNVIAEPLNIFAEVYKDENNPGVFKFVENWNATLDHMMNVQQHKPYYKHYHEVVEPMFIKPQEVEIFSRIPGNEWASVRKEFYPGRT